MATRPRKKAQKRISTRLASAPLAEVVFELRWALHRGTAPIPGATFDYDPMLIPLVERFSAEMHRAGFRHVRDFSHPMQAPPFSVVRRYHRSVDSPFPIMQIGSGIFATNESANYEWGPFKAQVLAGLKALFAAYPTEYDSAIVPSYLELRYVDVFDETILGNSGLADFAQKSTSLQFALPEYLDDNEVFRGDTGGRLLLQRRVRAMKDTQFSVDIGNGQHAETKANVIQLISKVVTTGSGVPKLSTSREFLVKAAEWLELSHGITSPFFKAFIQPSVMEKFNGDQG